MIISIPTQQGMINFCLNAPLLKLLASVVSILMLLIGYAVVQLMTFILNCSPVQFLHIVICTAFLACIFFVARFLLTRKGATI